MSRNISRTCVYQREWLDKLLTSKEVFYLRKEAMKLTCENPMIAVILAYVLIERSRTNIVSLSVDNIMAYAGLCLTNTKASKAADDIVKVLNENISFFFRNVDDDFKFSMRNRARIYVLEVNTGSLLSDKKYTSQGGKTIPARIDLIARILCNGTLKGSSEKLYDLLQMYFYFCINIRSRYGKYENDVYNKPIAFATYYSTIAENIRWVGDENIGNPRSRISKVSRIINELKKLNIIDTKRKNGYAVISNGIKENKTIITFYKNIGDYNPITRKKETVPSMIELDNAMNRQKYLDAVQSAMEVQ